MLLCSSSPCYCYAVSTHFFLIFWLAAFRNFFWACDCTIFEVGCLEKQTAEFERGFLDFISHSQRTVPLVISELWIWIPDDYLFMINVLCLPPVDASIGFKVHCSQDAGVAQSAGSTAAWVLLYCCASTQNAHTRAHGTCLCTVARPWGSVMGVIKCFKKDFGVPSKSKKREIFHSWSLCFPTSVGCWCRKLRERGWILLLEIVYDLGIIWSRNKGSCL